MIITKQKELPKLLEAVKPYKKIQIIGCGECATSCKTGGQEEVDSLKRILQREGKNVIKTSVPQYACDERLIRKELIDDCDVIISMSCGSGAAAVSAVTEKTVINTNDTLFLGTVKRAGKFDERCSLCGDCIASDYFGVCPVTRCAKGLLNGPCGGTNDGKCESDTDRDCAWALIYERAKKQGRIEQLSSYHKPKKHSEMKRPQKRDIHHEFQRKNIG